MVTVEYRPGAGLAVQLVAALEDDQVQPTSDRGQRLAGVA